MFVSIVDRLAGEEGGFREEPGLGTPSRSLREGLESESSFRKVSFFLGEKGGLWKKGRKILGIYRFGRVWNCRFFIFVRNK